MKKIISLLLICAMAISCVVLAGCDKSADNKNDTTAPTTAAGGEGAQTTGYVDPTESLTVQVSDDKYRNFYHIWVCSFHDSDGDETGDLQGIIDKLDYLNDGDPTTDTDLGVDGIWLSPMMPSDSYHKYDVDDYMDVDPEFGDLETFDKLIEECDKRGINVILDLVLNHCGTGHEFFQNALTEVKAGDFENHAKYYKFTAGIPGVEGWRQLIGTSIWYEGQFSGEMPEWNLAYQGTRDYFEEVAKFWLERGVDGFRLDAVKYMTDDETDGVEFLDWFYTTSQKYNPDVYMVGENWQGNSQLYVTYESGIDSQFAFDFATGGGHFAMAANSGSGKSLAAQLMKFDTNSVEANENVISAMFLSNHDMIRSANFFAQNLPYQKMGAAAYLLTPGNSFTYYGEEIGAVVPGDYSSNDAYFRGAMNWDDNVETTIWCTAEAYSEFPYGGVAQQVDDDNSLLSFYRRAIKIKNQNPEIARGHITETYFQDVNSLCAFTIEYEGKELLIVHNMDPDEAVSVTVSDIIENPVIRGDLYAAEVVDDNYSAIEDGTLSMPAQSSVVIASAE
ncbi:MAG: hypothetical protein IJV88_03180 [Ruminococcus sp.]|nr:hypothetical protein [Ruminococcus sp.]